MQGTAASHSSRAATAPDDPADVLPAEVSQLVAPGTPDAELAWQRFVERYSRLLLRVAFMFAPGYDGAMDRYAYILDELRRGEFARLRRFAADGRGRFTTWLVVVARRLCVDHHRRQYGRDRTRRNAGPRADRLARRRLTDLASVPDLLENVGDESGVDPLQAVLAEQRAGRLRESLAGLAPEDRLLLRLRYEEDLSAREIAELLGLPSPFHVYRRARVLCGMLKARLVRTGVGSDT